MQTMSNYYKIHQNLLKTFKLALQQEIPGVKLFDSINGLFYTKTGTPCKIGTPGQADCYGLYPTKNGLVYLQFEIKSGQARQSNVQKTWQAFIENNNGFYIVVHDNYSIAVEQIKDYLRSL